MYFSYILSNTTRELSSSGIIRKNSYAVHVQLYAWQLKEDARMHYIPVNPAYPSLPKFSLHGTNVEFPCKIHAAKYVTARRSASPSKIKLLPRGWRTRQKFETILGMQSQNVELKMRPRNFTHITARMLSP